MNLEAGSIKKWARGMLSNTFGALAGKKAGGFLRADVLLEGVAAACFIAEAITDTVAIIPAVLSSAAAGLSGYVSHRGAKSARENAAQNSFLSGPGNNISKPDMHRFFQGR
jgi:hypothetical protein